MVLKILAIAAVVATGLFLAAPHRTTATASQPVFSLASFGAAIVPVAFAYGGWQTANFVAAEIKQPERNLPRALLIGVAGVILLYTSVNWICVRALGPQDLASSTTPVSAVMRLALGNRGATLISAAIAISTLSFLSQSILTAPRVYFAMAEDGVFFRDVARINPRTRVPVLAIVLQSAFATIVVVSGRYEQILNYVVSMDFLFFALTATTIFVFRRRQNTRMQQGMDQMHHYRVPGHPATTVVFIALCCWIVVNTIYHYPQNTLIGIGFLLAGIPAYCLWQRRTKTTQCRRQENA